MTTEGKSRHTVAKQAEIQVEVKTLGPNVIELYVDIKVKTLGPNVIELYFDIKIRNNEVT